MKIPKFNSNRGEEYFRSDSFTSDLKNHAVKGVGLTLVSSFGTFFIQIPAVAILARLLEPNDFGLVAMVTAIYGFFQGLRYFGLLEATIQEKEINHEKISTLFWVNVAFSILITIIFMALGPLLSRFYGEPRITWIAIIISLDLFIGGLGTQHRALLARNFEFIENTGIEIASTIIAYGTAILLAWKGWGYWALVSRWVVYSMAQTAGVWIFCKWRPGLPAFGTGVMPMLKFGMNMLGNYSLSYVSKNIDRVLIGWRYGSLSLGYYDRAYYIYYLPVAKISFPIVNVANTTLSKLRDDLDKYKRYYLDGVSSISFVSFLISAIVVVMSKDLVLLFLGPQWGQSAKLLSVFGVVIGIQMVYGTNAWIHLSMGRSDRLFRWNILAATCIVTSITIGLRFGLLGVIIAYAATIHILVGPCLWYAGKNINLKLATIISVIWKNYLSAICSGLFLWYIFYSFDFTNAIFIELNVFTRLVTSTTIFALSYVFMIKIILRGSIPIAKYIPFLKEMVPNVFKSNK